MIEQYSWVIYVIAGLLAVFLPLAASYGLLVCLALCGFFRAELTLGAVPLGVRPEDMVLGVLTMRCLLRRSPRLSNSIRQVLWSVAILLLAIGGYTLYSLATHSLAEVNFYLHVKAIGSILAVYIALSAITSPADYRRFVIGLMLGTLVMLGATLITPQTVNHYTKTSLYDAQMYETKKNQGQAFAGWNPNMIGIGAGCSLVLVLPIALLAGSKRVRYITTLFCLITAAGLLRSYSRTAILAAGAAVLYTLWVTLGRRSVPIIVVATSIVAGMFWAGLDVIRPEAFQFSFSDNVNVGDRTRYWQEAVQAIAAQPLGYGIGVEDRAFGAMVGDQKRASAHNDWLDYGLGMGLAGMILAVAAFGRMYGALWSGTAIVKRNWLSVGVRATLIFFGVCSVGGQVFSFAKLPFLIFAAQIAIVNGISRVNRKGLGRFRDRERLASSEAGYVLIPSSCSKVRAARI